jgi:hypothetical protein
MGTENQLITMSYMVVKRTPVNLFTIPLEKAGKKYLFFEIAIRWLSD